MRVDSHRFAGRRGEFDVLSAAWERARAGAAGVVLVAGEAGGESASELAQIRLFEFLLQLLSGLGQDGPVLLIVEDVHWADHSTLDF